MVGRTPTIPTVKPEILYLAMARLVTNGSVTACATRTAGQTYHLLTDPALRQKLSQKALYTTMNA